MHDLKLSRAHKLNNTFIGYQYPIADISASSRPPVAAFHSLFKSPKLRDLSAAEVRAVFVRWYYMKDLADLYLRPALLSEYVAADLPYIPPTIDGSDPSSQNEQDFHFDQSPKAPLQLKAQDIFYTRFYQAVSALWLLSEAITLANTIQYASIAEYKEIRQLLGTILDPLNIKELFVLCEVDNFLYSFILPKTFAPYAKSWSEFRDYVAGDLSDRNTFAHTWKRTMKIIRLSVSPKAICELLIRYAENEPLPRSMSWILRSSTSFGLRESNMIGRITNIDGLLPKQRLGPMDFGAKDLQRCASSLLRTMPAYEYMSNSAVSAGWKSFLAGTGLRSWHDRVKGGLAGLDDDWEDYRLDGLHAHIMVFHEKELAVKERRMMERRTRINAARTEAPILALQQADETADEDETANEYAMDTD
jgi:hypothetical protein